MHNDPILEETNDTFFVSRVVLEAFPSEITAFKEDHSYFAPHVHDGSWYINQQCNCQNDYCSTAQMIRDFIYDLIKDWETRTIEHKHTGDNPECVQVFKVLQQNTNTAVNIANLPIAKI